MMRKPVTVLSLIGVIAVAACQEPYGGRQEGPSPYPGPPATTPKPPSKQPMQSAEVAMSTSELRQKLTGFEMYGCYPNDAPFALMHRKDGALIDMQQNASVVGTWRVEDGQVCYDYTAGPAAGQGGCYQARKAGSNLNFYSGDRFIASTMCPFPKPVGQ